jgi:hypothetical protein
MLLDDMIKVEKRLDDWHFYKRAQWRLKFVFLPKKCDLSKKLIWLKFAYQGESVYTGPGTPISEFRWINKKEFLFAKIRGII